MKQPLGEVFGFPIQNDSKEAARHRSQRLCPFGNKVPNCTKDKARAPLGVCSILDEELVEITCPVRFRENWFIADDAARFFFPEGTKWTSMSEIRLNDAHGRSAGNIDFVLVSYDNNGKILDFGALEVQAVYISGNVRNPFESYMSDATPDFSWEGQLHSPRADYLSSSRKRLIPQLMFKGGILKHWKKKTAVALTASFFDTLPELPEVDERDADIAWLLYSLRLNAVTNRLQLCHDRTVYTEFDASLKAVAQATPGEISSFVEKLQESLDSQLDPESLPPETRSLDDILRSES